MAEAKAHKVAGFAADRQPVAYVVMLPFVARDNRGAALGQPVAIGHSPWALARLRQKCVLLI